MTYPISNHIIPTEEDIDHILQIRELDQDAIDRIHERVYTATRENPRDRKRTHRKHRTLITIVAAALVICIGTAIASDLPSRIRSLFYLGEPMTEMMNAVADSARYDIAVTDNDITVRVEAAYTSKEGTYIIISFDDAKKRLIDNHIEYDLKIGDALQKTLINVVGTTVDTETGRIYSLLHWPNVYMPEDDVQLTIRSIGGYKQTFDRSTGIDLRKAYQEHELTGERVQFNEYPGFSITNMLFEEEGLRMQCSFDSAAYPRRTLEFVGIVDDSGDIKATFKNTMGQEIRPYSSLLLEGFTSLDSLSGYTLFIVFRDNDRVIYGTWSMDVQFARNEEEHIQEVNKRFTIGERIYRIDQVVYIPGALIVEGGVVQNEAEGLDILDLPSINLELLDADGVVIDSKLEYLGNTIRWVYPYTSYIPAQIQAWGNDHAEPMLQLRLEEWQR